VSAGGAGSACGTGAAGAASVAAGLAIVTGTGASGDGGCDSDGSPYGDDPGGADGAGRCRASVGRARDGSWLATWLRSRLSIDRTHHASGENCNDHYFQCVNPCGRNPAAGVKRIHYKLC